MRESDVTKRCARVFTNKKRGTLKVPVAPGRKRTVAADRESVNQNLRSFLSLVARQLSIGRAIFPPLPTTEHRLIRGGLIDCQLTVADVSERKRTSASTEEISGRQISMQNAWRAEQTVRGSSRSTGVA